MSKRIVYLTDYEEEAELRRENFGKTNKYTTGLSGLDLYLGHGFGNKHGYEIVLVFGEPGIGKSTFALNMLGRELTHGTKVGLMILEDDMADVYNRMLGIIGKTGMESLKRNKNMDVLPPEMTEKAWTFEEILDWIKNKHQERGIELFMVDHINFVFDNMEQIKGENEIIRQRRFMQQLNFLCKKRKLTVILVAHTAKGDAEGMAKVYGSTSLIQVPTKVIGVRNGEGQDFIVQLYKSRFTMRQDDPWVIRRTGLKLEEPIYQPVIMPKKKGEKWPSSPSTSTKPPLKAPADDAKEVEEASSPTA